MQRGSRWLVVDRNGAFSEHLLLQHEATSNPFPACMHELACHVTRYTPLFGSGRARPLLIQLVFLSAWLSNGELAFCWSSPPREYDCVKARTCLHGWTKRHLRQEDSLRTSKPRRRPGASSAGHQHTLCILGLEPRTERGLPVSLVSGLLEVV